MKWYLEALKKYAVFKGRARRKEYWTFALVNVVIAVGLVLLEGLAGIAPEADVSVLATLFYLVVLLPSVAVAIRRLHDTNRSGWWILVALMPFIGGLLLLLLMLEDGTPGANRYGDNPKWASA